MRNHAVEFLKNEGGNRSVITMFRQLKSAFEMPKWPEIAEPSSEGPSQLESASQFRWRTTPKFRSVIDANVSVYRVLKVGYSLGS